MLTLSLILPPALVARDEMISLIPRGRESPGE